MPKTKKSAETTKPETTHTQETPTIQAPAASLGGTPVVTMPKFNPYVRSATTREPDPTPLRQSYEDIQREAKGPGSDEWRKADKLRADLTNLYDSLREDERYAQGYKSERAWAEYQKVREQVEQLAPTAREKMLKSADNLERLSVPHPEGESLITKDTDKLLLTAHERARLEGVLNRAEQQGEKTGGTFKQDPHKLLKAEYERGFDEGGPGGGATVRAIVGIARDFGLDLDKIIEGRRKDYHYESLEDAARARMRANLVGRSVPEPPFPHPLQGSRSRDVGTYGGGGRMFVDRGPASLGAAQRKPGASRRRPYWR
jgi:hypothetical protein